MGQKARNGGTLGRAKLDYLNHIDHSDGRVIRTIIVDPERAPFVQLGFELFSTGDYTQEELADELYDRGLRTRATRRHQAKKVSENKISQMLRDRYYLGYVEERRRVHHHYLKGSLFCGRCQRDGIKRRMIIQRTINSKGAEYLYFFCRGRQKGLCQAPHVNVTLVEDAVERHYSAIRFSQPFIADMRDQIDAVLGEQESPHACCASRSPHSSRNSTRRRRT
nr:recombinase family protein [Actinosynnema sp. ALI-1.44]